METKCSEKEVAEDKIPPQHQNLDNDLEHVEGKKYPYPKAILFIISTEFCERFSFYGMKSKFTYIAN